MSTKQIQMRGCDWEKIIRASVKIRLLQARYLGWHAGVYKKVNVGDLEPHVEILMRDIRELVDIACKEPELLPDSTERV